MTLLRRSERTVSELATELGLTDNGIRLHVAALERDGLVEASGRRQEWTGKPAVLYRTTAEAEAFFPKAYARILSALLQELTRARGSDEASELLRQAGHRLGIEAASSHGDVRHRVHHAAAVLESIGGLVEVEEHADGFMLQGYSCPLAALLPQHPEACGLAEALVSALVGTEVEECCDRGVRPRCAFRVNAA